MGNKPSIIDGVTVKPPAQMIIDAAIGHFLQS